MPEQGVSKVVPVDLRNLKNWFLNNVFKNKFLINYISNYNKWENLKQSNQL